ncbi:P-loop containing nucleoside triphosphate hydrolase protein [Mycena vitilis]|nr:P-loop containing nucleoside triphosphate hydrolase protein [Mycena vitilis]
MISLLTDLLSSLNIVSAADVDAPLLLQHCSCRPLYPDLARNIEKICRICGNLKPEVEYTHREKGPSIASRVPSQTKLPPTPPKKTKELRYLNAKLTASLTSIANDPVLIARRGSLAVFGPGETLYEYQAVDLRRLQEREAAGLGTLLAYAMGLGKTVLSTALICTSQSVPPGAFRTTLVIAPTIGILQQWKTELKRFAPKLHVLLYHGSGESGKTADPRVPDVTLLTIAEVRNQWAAFTDENVSDDTKFPLYTGTFKRVIIDEAQTIRNPETASAKACWALKKCYGLCLSGTPAQNKLEDIYPLLKFLDVRSEGLNDLTTFHSRVTNPYRQGEIEKTTELLVVRSHPHVCPWQFNRLSQRVLSECMIYRTKDLQLGGVELPKLHDAVLVRIQLTPAERAVYNYIRDIHPFKSQWAKAVRLRQAADHPALLKRALQRGDIGPKPDHTSDQMRILLDDSCAAATDVIKQDTPLKPLPPFLAEHAAVFESTYISSKLSAILAILKRIPKGQKVLVFSHFVTNLDLMAEVLRGEGVSYARYHGLMGPSERTAALVRIRDDETCRVLLMSIMAGGTGLDIPACNHVMLVEPWWNPYVEDQAISRVHRIGQRREVRVYKLLVKDSIEDSIVKTQDAKREVIGGLLSLCAVPDVNEMRKWLT